MTDEKYPDSPKNIILEELCLDSRFGDLKFQNSLPALKKMRDIIIELEGYDYRNNLTQQEINQIDSARNTYNSYIQRLSSFTLEQPNPKEMRDGLENEIIAFYNNTFALQTRISLTFLRQDSKSGKVTEKELKEILNNAKKIEKELQEKQSKISRDRESIEKESGIVSSQYLSKVFRSSSDNSKGGIKKWVWMASILILLLVVSIVVLFLVYVVRLMKDVDIRTEFAVFSTLWIASLFYLLRLAIRNYNILNHLRHSNAHRANVAETLENFITSAGNDQETKTALLKEAAIAMFQSDSTGYLTKDQIEVTSPVKEMINTIISDKKQI